MKYLILKSFGQADRRVRSKFKSGNSGLYETISDKKGNTCYGCDTSIPKGDLVLRGWTRIREGLISEMFWCSKCYRAMEEIETTEKSAPIKNYVFTDLTTEVI